MKVKAIGLFILDGTVAFFNNTGLKRLKELEGTHICKYNLCTMRLKELGGTKICTYIYGMYYGLKGGTSICTLYICGM